MKYIELKNNVLDVISERIKGSEYEGRVYVAGGFVRDLIMHKTPKDIDLLVDGGINAGIQFAIWFCKHNGLFKEGENPIVYGLYGTAMFQFMGEQIECVAPRSEKYNSDSRNPEVTSSTIFQDCYRRDFTINSMFINLSSKELLDYSNSGMTDIENGVIRCTSDPSLIFEQDPLRMMRAIRFASTLGFTIEEKTLAAIKANVKRIDIITQERITDEMVKILKSKKPSIGFQLLKETKLLREVFPELQLMTYTEMRNDRRHKDMFAHTLKVLDNVAEKTDDLYVRIAALLHDIGKPRVKDFDPEKGWTFFNHAHVGAGMIPGIFKRLKLPLGSEMELVKKLVYLHMDPINLVNGVATDSAVRRLLFEAGDDIDALMILCDSDVTSRHEDKVAAVHQKYADLLVRMAEIEEKDHLRNFKLPIDGDDIMQMFNLTPCRLVGDIKGAIKEAILDGTLENDREKAMEFAKAEYGRLTEGKA